VAQAGRGRPQIERGAPPFDGMLRVPRVGFDQPPPAADEPIAARNPRQDLIEVTRVFEPIVVVEPHDHAPARLRDGGVAGIDLAAARVPARVDARIAESECSRQTAAVVDHQRLPVAMPLALQRSPGVAQGVGALVGRRDHTDARAGRVAGERQRGVTMNPLRCNRRNVPPGRVPRPDAVGGAIAPPTAIDRA
jgi:hypothetical protein